MHKLLFISTIVLASAFTSKENRYDVIFAEDYSSAQKFVTTNCKLFATSSSKYGHSSQLLSSIVFPELMRYSKLKDVLETGALEMAYVDYGTSTADFSIGRFQMKPSFVEDLENQIAKNDSLRKIYAGIINFKSSDEKAIRKERLSRMTSNNWQLTYLNCFVSLVQHKFKSQEFPDITDSIRFYAAAYNGGWHKGAEKIIESESLNYFPYGTKYNGKQYAYSDVAEYFYKHTYKKYIRSNN